MLNNHKHSLNKNAFSDFFNSAVIHNAVDIEKQRRTFLIWIAVLNIFPFLSVVLVLKSYLAYNITIPSILIAVFLVLFTLLAASFPIFKIFEKIYSQSAKKELLPQILNFWGEFKYSRPKNNPILYIQECIKKKIPIEATVKGFSKLRLPESQFDFRAIDLLLDYDQIDFGDVITGTYRGLNIEICEADTYSIQKKTDGKNTKLSTFKGVMFAIDVKKPFKGVTALSGDFKALSRLNDSSKNALVDNVENLLQAEQEIAKVINYFTAQKDNPEKIASELVLNNNPNRIQCKKINLGYFEFEGRFGIYSDNADVSKNILNDKFLADFLKFSKKYKYNLKAIFVNQRLYIMVETPNKNWFEVPFISSAMHSENYNKIFYQMSEILNIVDALNNEQILSYT